MQSADRSFVYILAGVPWTLNHVLKVYNINNLHQNFDFNSRMVAEKQLIFIYRKHFTKFTPKSSIN